MRYFSSFILIVFSFTSSFAQKDTIPPIISILGDTTCIEPNSVWIEPVSVSDNQTDSANISLQRKWGSNGAINISVIGRYPITYIATDTNGNKTILDIAYTVDDCIPPVIMLNTPDSICHHLNTPYISVQPTVTDNYSLSHQISFVKLSSNINIYVQGVYSEVFEATDHRGNKSVKTRLVKVDICNNSSVKSINTTNILIYPNPVNDYFFVSTPYDNSLMTLISMEGLIIQRKTLNSGQNIIQSNLLSTGIYILTIFHDDILYHYQLKVE